MALYRDEVGIHTEESSLIAGTTTIYEHDFLDNAGATVKLDFSVQGRAVGTGGDVFGVSGRYLGFFQVTDSAIVPIPADASPVIIIQDGGLKYDTDIGTAPTVAATINATVLTIEAGAADCNAQWVTEGSCIIQSGELPETPVAP